MEKALFEQHVSHFGQADGTSPTKPPILNFGKYAEQPLEISFQTGTLNMDELYLDLYTKEFLKELQRTPTNPPEISTTITAKDIK
eukprot:952234-Ditylum_brightwellii.AAC.1